MNKRSLHIIILIFIPFFLFGQSLEGVIKDAENLVKKAEITLTFPENETKIFLPFQQFKLEKNKNVNLLEIDLKTLESNQYKNDIGLVFKANANHNFSDALDEETNTSIITSVKAEVEWNVLKSGYFENQTKAKRVENQIVVLKEESDKVQKELWRKQFKIDYNYVLNKEVIHLQKTFLSFENDYFDLLNKLYYQKLIKREKLLQVSSQIHVLEEQITTLEKENVLLRDSVSTAYLKIKKLPLLKVRLDSFSLKETYAPIHVKEENIHLQQHRLNDINLSLYVNQNYRYSEATQRYFPSVGIRFKAPLRFNNRKKIIETKIKILKAQEADTSLEQFNNTLTYISEYNEKLKDLQNEYKNWQVLEERIRILKIIKEEFKTQDTGTLLLDFLEEQFRILENVLQLKRQLYKVITRLFELNETSKIDALFVPYTFKKTTNLERLVLVSSKKYSLNFQLNFLKAKGLSVVVLRNDLAIQEKLKNRSINYVLVNKSTKTVEQFIKEEVERIKIKTDESI